MLIEEFAWTLFASMDSTALSSLALRAYDLYWLI